MNVRRYRVNRAGQLEESDTGLVLRVCDHWKEVERLQKIIDEQSVTIKKLKANKQSFFLVQRWYGSSNPERDVKDYNELQSFLDYLAEDKSITAITVCALQPIKVTCKQVLTVEL
jgi:hypothetical protein